MITGKLSVLDIDYLSQINVYRSMTLKCDECGETTVVGPTETTIKHGLLEEDVDELGFTIEDHTHLFCPKCSN